MATPKPPRRNLPPEAENWGRFVDNDLAGIKASQQATLTNLSAALAANTSSLNRLATLGDKGWTDLPALSGGLNTSVSKYRTVGGWVQIVMAITGSFIVGENTVYGGGFLNSDIYPDQSASGTAILAAGFVGAAEILTTGAVTVYNQTGATRSGCRLTLTYPLKTTIIVPESD